MDEIKTKKREGRVYVRIFTYILGIIIVSISLSFIYLYTNVLTIGLTFGDYLLYISKKWECLMLFLGIILLVYSFRKG